MSPAARAAVVTVTHNSSAVLGQWLDALEQSSLRDELELCVVDSGSRDHEREIARELCAGRVEHFLAVPNLGFGRATNVGVDRTSAPLIMLLNPDATIEDLPADLLDPGAVAGTIVGPRLLPERPDGSAAGFRHAPTAGWEAASLLLGRHSSTYRQTFDDPAYVSGGTLLMTRADFDRLGGFTSELFLFFEDADLGLRHRALGGKLRIDSRWVVDHPGAQGSGGLWRSDALDGLARQSARRLSVRHGRRSSAKLLWLLLTLVYIPRRIAVGMVRGELPARELLEMTLDLLLPSRTMRRLRAVLPDPVAPWGAS